MYINDTNIFLYVAIGILGLIVGKFVELVVTNLPEHKKIFSIEVIKEYLKTYKTQYFLIIVISLIYINILLLNGTKDIIKLIQYIVLTPMLISAFYIDCKKQIIPNRLTLLMCETGLVFSFLRGINNLNVAIEMWIGSIVGAGIFLVITFLGNLIFKKETMGFGDVKLMGTLGLFFGWRSIIAITILAFFIAVIYSIVLIIKKLIKEQKIEEYIPFGPFIVLASFILMFVPLDVLIKITFWIFTFGKYKL